VAPGTFGVMRWLALAFCLGVGAVPAYWAYESFAAIASDHDTAASFFIVWGSILALGSLAAVMSGVVLFVLWPRFRDRDPRPRWVRRSS
jgi:hypothetical protein